MTDTINSPQTSILKLARAGNVRAIARLLNQALRPYGLKATVGVGRPGCLKVLVELPSQPQRRLPDRWYDSISRSVCRHIWQMNSAKVDRVHIAIRRVGRPEILWRRSVRVVSPARRQYQQARQLQRLQSRVDHTIRRKKRVRTLRALVFSGPAVAAFLVGSVVGYSKAPVDQVSAAASTQSPNTSSLRPQRPDVVQAASGKVPVTKHQGVANPNDPTVSLMFGGDVTLSDAFAEAIGTDYPRALSQMDETRKVDLAMVNLEGPLTRSTEAMSKQFNFKADPAAVDVLKSGGIDLVTLANNHAMDYQTAGLVETMQTLDNAGILHLGAGRNLEEARRPEIIDVKGQRIAYLAYYGEEYAAGANSAGTNPILEERIAQDIKAIRPQVDWVVINYHWGQELAEYPADWQVQLAHFTVDQGADVVVGHHPHVLQGAELYKGRPIAYSLGNFIFGGNSRSDYDTAVMRVALKDQQMKVEFLPVEVRNYQPKVVGGGRGNDILSQIQTLSSGFQQPMSSPVVLDARSTPAPSGAASSPTAAPLAPTPVAPVAPAVQQPTAPGQPQAFPQPSDSFINSPGRTPLTPTAPQSPDGGPEATTPQATDSNQTPSTSPEASRLDETNSEIAAR
ncbi:MAG: CapA family protein [Leptolyngbyaceae cyanobacterium]